HRQRAQERAVAIGLERRAADDAAGVAGDEERGQMLVEAVERQAAVGQQAAHVIRVAVLRAFNSQHPVLLLSRATSRCTLSTCVSAWRTDAWSVATTGSPSAASVEYIQSPSRRVSTSPARRRYARWRDAFGCEMFKV